MRIVRLIPTHQRRRNIPLLPHWRNTPPLQIQQLTLNHLRPLLQLTQLVLPPLSKLLTLILDPQTLLACANSSSNHLRLGQCTLRAYLVLRRWRDRQVCHLGRRYRFEWVCGVLCGCWWLGAVGCWKWTSLDVVEGQTGFLGRYSSWRLRICSGLRSLPLDGRLQPVDAVVNNLLLLEALILLIRSRLSPNRLVLRILWRALIHLNIMAFIHFFPFWRFNRHNLLGRILSLWHFNRNYWSGSGLLRTDYGRVTPSVFILR